MAYLGNTPTTQSFISGTDYFNGTGAQTAFTLTRTVASVNDIEAVVNNVVQQPNDAYNISGTTITFTSAPSAGTNNVYVRYLSTTTQAITPSQNTVNYNTFDSNMQSAIGTGNKNRIINGAMTISQRNGTSSVTPTSSVYTLDRWNTNLTQSSKFSVQQNAGSVTPPAGFTNYLGVTSTSAYSVLATDFFSVIQSIEGFNVADLGWGTANAKTVTLSFWVRSSLTGTFGGSLNNGGFNRAYPFTYTISAANTWEQKSVTIAGDTTGTWATGNTTGIHLYFNLGAGSNFSGTAGAWVASGVVSATGATSVVGTNGATFYITGVQLEAGTQATSFEYRQVGTELALCQRYAFMLAPAESFIVVTAVLGFDSTRAFDGTISAFPVTMRAKPTATASGTWDTVDGTSTQGSQPLGFVPVGTYGYRGVIASDGNGLVANRFYIARTASTTSQVLFNAEL
jgi:hypothetical protein